MSVLLCRVDGGSGIGAGHIMRCLALAQRWQEGGGSVVFLTARIGQHLRTRLEGEGMEILELCSMPGTVGDSTETLQQAQTLSASWVVVDGYHFDQSYQDQLGSGQFSVLWLDDCNQCSHYRSELVLNQNLAARADLYASLGAESRLLTGSRFVLLRREFRRFSRRQGTSRTVSKVLVSLGGGDFPREGEVVLDAVARAELAPILVSGSRESIPQKLRALIESKKIEWHYGVARMPELMASADLAVSAAGCTSWELAFLGIPSVLTILAENQQPNAIALAESGAAIDVGWLNVVEVDALAGHLRKLFGDLRGRERMIENGQRLIDGFGVDRVFALMRGDRLWLRSAELKDAQTLWKWTNEPAVRAASFSSESIPWNEHESWFRSKLHDEACSQYLAFDTSDRPIGQVRYEIGPKTAATLGISISEEKRGKKFGTDLLRLACQRFFLDRSDIETINAFIKPENRASLSVFVQTGFRRAGSASVKGQQADHYVFERRAQE